MKRIAALALVGAALLSRAAVTNEVDMAALRAVADNNATPTTNGWTLFSIGLYSDPVLQFNSKDDWMVSEDFGMPILRMEFSVRCTANTARRLAVFNESTGEQVCEFALCKKGNTDELQPFDFALEEAMTQFRLKVNPHDSTTGFWGIGSLKVITAEPAVEPSNLGVSKKGDDWCVLSWSNGEGTVSNRVDTTLVERSEEGETVLFSTGFDSFSAAGNPEPKTNELAKIDAALSGLRIYSPANTTGVCQIAIGTASGYLRHSGFADYSGISLKLVLKQYPGDNAGTQIAYEIGDEIKVFGDKIPLPEEFEERIVDLNDIPDGAAILIGYDTVPSKRRVLVDSLEFVRKGVETKTLVDSRWLPASPGAASFSTKGVLALPARAECRFEVRAQNADGIVSDAAGVETKLGGTPGARLILR